MKAGEIQLAAEKTHGAFQAQEPRPLVIDRSGQVIIKVPNRDASPSSMPTIYKEHIRHS